MKSADLLKNVDNDQKLDLKLLQQLERVMEILQDIEDQHRLSKPTNLLVLFLLCELCSLEIHYTVVFRIDKLINK